MLHFKKELPKVLTLSPTMGCDPEFFFKLDGQVIGAEKLLPEKGLKSKDSKFIIDGVQAELNPRPNTCRALLGNEISACFKTLQEHLKTKGKGISVDFSRTVEISKENLMELDEKSRKFGCAPSENIYTSKKLFSRKTTVAIDAIDPAEYRIRAAGGHIHIGKGSKEYGSGLYRAICKDYSEVIEMLDLLCGNTSVLIDRDEGNIERRKVYGKAGEYRLPSHGLEYRTLSNFWLTSRELMSFAFGMARLAVQVIADEKNHDMLYKEFTSKVKLKNVHDAINNNDFDLAMENFKRIEPLIADISTSSGHHAISGAVLQEFTHFVNCIKTNGLNYWFKEDPMTHWTKNTDAHSHGFHDFLASTVRKDMDKPQKLAA